MGTQVYKVGDVMANGARVIEVDAKGRVEVASKPKNGNGDGLAGKSVIASAQEAKVAKAQTKSLAAAGKAVVKGTAVNAAAVMEKLQAATRSVVKTSPKFQGDAELAKAHAKLKAEAAAKSDAKGKARKEEAARRKAFKADGGAVPKPAKPATPAKVAKPKAEKPAKAAKPAKPAPSTERVAAKRSPKDLTDAQVAKAHQMKKDGESCRAIGLALGITPESAWRLVNPKKYAAQGKAKEVEEKQTASVPKPARRSKK
jgi:histone H1/5